MVKIERFKNQVFNKPVGVVRSQERTAESETWETISRISSALSGEFYKKAVDEAKEAGTRQALSVDVFDENMQITKAPLSMGTIGTKAFEETMLRRYETNMRSLIDTKIGDALRNNPTDTDQYNTDASIATAGLIDNADPAVKGILTDYATAKIAIGNNTVLANTKKIEDEQTILNVSQTAQTLANQAINAFANGQDGTGARLMEEIEKQYNDLILEGVITGGGADQKIVELRRRVMEQRIGIALNNLSSEEIIMVADSFGKQQLDDLPDTEIMISRGASFDRMKSLLGNNPHILDNPTIKRVINSVKVNQAQYEETLKQVNIARNLTSALDQGIRIDIGKKEMGVYSQYVFGKSGVELQTTKTGLIIPPTKDQMLLLADSKNPNSINFYRILAEQRKIPKVMEDKFQALVDGTLDAEESFAVLEIYQNMARNMSTTGLHRDLTQGMGMSDSVSAKMRALNSMLTFNSTIEGIRKAVDFINQPEDVRFARLKENVNIELGKKSDKYIDSIGTIKNIIKGELFSNIKDSSIVDEVIDETMFLAMATSSVKDAINIMSDTVNRTWVESSYAVDMNSGGTVKRTRFAPELVFSGEALQTFENKVKQLSGIQNPVLGENVFVIVDPNSANSNVRYYIATGEEGSLDPVVVDNQLVSIELMEFAGAMSKQYEDMIKKNLEFAGMIVQRNKKLQEYQFLDNNTIGSMSLDEQFNVDLSKAQEFGYGF